MDSSGMISSEDLIRVFGGNIIKLMDSRISSLWKCKTRILVGIDKLGW